MKREHYAHGELVAELGASFVSGAIGIKLQDRENHAALSVLLADRKMGKRLRSRPPYAAPSMAQATGWQRRASEGHRPEAKAQRRSHPDCRRHSQHRHSRSARCGFPSRFPIVCRVAVSGFKGRDHF
ncbi:hypothetical protein [Sphingomonas sp. PP-CE-1G-424]|uniref:hypothetical protein n=1 Tax=Sphingomonas sp. PP-CE-1G-424 TaxID=2135658 RepID=UPI001404E8E6|nr:hypothetical protein [Sphingomonas sp. PP-CE-1G-424]